MAQATVKKISIFPFEVTIDASGVIHKANALKITPVGMMLEVASNSLQPGMAVVLKWVLPIELISMQEEAKIVKLYSQQREKHIQYLIEVHFKHIKPQNADAIKSLLDRYEAAQKKQAEKNASKKGS